LQPFNANNTKLENNTKLNINNIIIGIFPSRYWSRKMKNQLAILIFALFPYKNV